MTQFSITLANLGQEPGVPEELQGTLVLGGHVEKFRTSLSYWNAGDYEASWREAIRSLVAGKDARSALIVNMLDPATANFIEWWPMYRRSESIVIYNQLLFIDDSNRMLVKASPMKLLVAEGELADEDDDQPPSSWRVSVQEMEQFLVNSEAPQSEW